MKKFTTVEEYLDSFPKEVKTILQELRKTIKAELPKNAEEVISYQMPCFKVNKKYVIYFAAWKEHVSIYPFFEELEKDMPEVKKYKRSGKGTIQFPLNEPLPLDLIRKITQALLTNRLKSSY